MELFQHQITNENISQFQRYVHAPKDCVINAMHIIGLLDNFTSNLIRLTCVGKEGLEIDQIQKIFTLFSIINGNAHEFLFLEAPAADGMSHAKMFEKVVIERLKPEHILFCGYEKNGFKHVFLLGRYLDGRIMYIDPQVDGGVICDINNDKCFSYISGAQKYYILHFNPKNLTQKEINEMGIIM
jgi:hypothetical protein